MGMAGTPVLAVEDLWVEFKSGGVVRAVSGASFQIQPGQAVAVVGESGSGKSTIALAVMRLLPVPAGRIVRGQVRLKGQDLTLLSEGQMRRVRGAHMGMVFQDPLTCLNPVLTIGQQLAEPLQVHRGMRGPALRRRCLELLELVGIPAAAQRLQQYPHQLSGGLRQRVMIAMALACDPDLLIADEPTTALDVTVQAQILHLIRGLQRRLGLSVLWITHDLGVAAGLCDHVVVLYASRVMEQGPAAQVLLQPAHPYTKGLLACVPRADIASQRRLPSLPGGPPDLRHLTAGCPFEPRCPVKLERCAGTSPPLLPVAAGQQAACWRAEEGMGE